MIYSVYSKKVLNIMKLLNDCNCSENDSRNYFMNGNVDLIYICTVKPVLRGLSKEDQKLVFKTDYRLMQVESIAECSKRAREHSAILSTFIKQPFSL